ncbi:MAG: GGDEF domain-containing protein [Labilithrix sp.]
MAMSLAPSSTPPSAAAWQLIRDDVFDRILDDAELERLVAEKARVTSEPHAEIVRVMLGMNLSEEEARALFQRAIAHRQEMSRALGRQVHIRVAALDLIMSRPASRRSPRESRPVMMAPAFLERALEEASADSVTGLPRAAHYMNLLQHELRQRGRSIVVVYIDLDGFKLVNDQHGHACGDDILRTMADAARTTLRRGDVLARVGGDEFALLLLDASPEEAQHVVERLRARFEELTAAYGTSFSAGLAFSDGNASANELVARADQAMYRDKHARRR